ncbi:MAG: gamma-glutamyltransferase family protein [Dongiaceae bacterium]
MDPLRALATDATKSAVSSSGGIVAAQNRLAAAEGARVLAAGGNAIDAAVVTSFALGVLEPWMSGIGGGGFMVVAKADGSPVQVIDGAMVAPSALDPADYPLTGGTAGDLFAWPAVKDDRNITGHHSIAVPGLVDGMGLALARFGTIAWRDALAPAIRLAEAGLPLDWYAGLCVAVAARELSQSDGASIVYLPDGLPPVPNGENGLGHLPLGELAHTLRRLADAGPRDLYDGEIAVSIARELQAGGSRLSAEDLRGYRAAIHPALDIPYRNVVVAAAPGLSAGPTLARTLELLGSSLTRRADLAAGPGADEYVAYADALNIAYGERLAAAGHAVPAATCTSHVSVVDREGTMVSLTQTLLSRFGSKVLLPATGVLMNNGIMWFDPRPGRPNSIAPGRRPLSNMCPVIVRRDREPWLALGASGGRRILPAIAQLVSFLVDFGMSLQEAFHCPRLDMSGDGRVTADERLAEPVRRNLAAQWPVIDGFLTAYPVMFGSPNAVLRDIPRRRNHGMADVASPWSGAVAESS